jgi:hypothetical protein
MLKRSFLPSGSDALGWKVYGASTIAVAAGCPAMVGGSLAEAVGIDAIEAVKRSATARIVGDRRRWTTDESIIGGNSAQAQNIPPDARCIERALCTTRGVRLDGGAAEARSAMLTSRRLLALRFPSYGGDPAIRDVRSTYAYAMGPEALRHRLSAVMPLFDAAESPAGARRVVSGDSAMPRRDCPNVCIGRRVHIASARALHSYSGSVNPCCRKSRVQAATRCRS